MWTTFIRLFGISVVLVLLIHGLVYLAVRIELENPVLWKKICSYVDKISKIINRFFAAASRFFHAVDLLFHKLFRIMAVFEVAHLSFFTWPLFPQLLKIDKWGARHSWKHAASSLVIMGSMLLILLAFVFAMAKTTDYLGHTAFYACIAYYAIGAYKIPASIRYANENGFIEAKIQSIF